MTESELTPALRSYLRANRRALEQHPSVEDLVGYRAGALEPVREEAVRDHLVACQECSELLLELANLEDTAGLADTASELEIEAAWKRQRGRLFPSRSYRGLYPWQLGGWAAAACLALVTGFLGFKLRELHQESARLYSGDLSRVIVEQQGTRRLQGDLPVLELGSGKAGLVLVLLHADTPFESFRAELVSPDGRALLVLEGLSLAEDLLLIPIKPHQLPPGRIRVVVSGLREGQYEPVEDYDLQVRYL